MWPFKKKPHIRWKKRVELKPTETVQPIIWLTDKTTIEGRIHQPYVYNPPPGQPWASSGFIHLSAYDKYKAKDPTYDLDRHEWVWVTDDMCIPRTLIYTITLKRTPITVEIWHNDI